MKKNLDKNKISNFKNRAVNYHHYSSFCMKTKPNSRYFNAEIKKITTDYLARWGGHLKENDPALYYSMINRPLPKKYKKPSYPIAPVNAYVPEQSKLSHEELQAKLARDLEIRKQKEAEEQKRKQAEKLEQERLRRNREAYEKEKSYIYWCDPFQPINQNKLGNSQIIRKKKYIYY